MVLKEVKVDVKGQSVLYLGVLFKPGMLLCFLARHISFCQ